MCGIVGIMDVEGRGAIDETLLRRMNDIQVHRGPDGDGIYIKDGVGFGHRRLAIIDLANGAQPMQSADGSTVVCYNGEIYNHRDLAKELMALGCEFTTNCDTEVILHAWQKWGPECVKRFNGMFAFAIWDRRSKAMFLARDRLGIKPLYYSFLPTGQLVFASELKGLTAHPDLLREIDPFAVEDFFAYGYIPEPRSIFKGAHKLPPGHTLLVERGNLRAEPKQYWDVQFSVDGPPRSEEEICGELIEHFKDAVDIRLMSEVPLGAFLSGGVDSSAVVALMSELSSEPVKTCSISFGDPKFNEVQYANKIAARYETEHLVEQVDADDFDLIDKLANVYDEPFADSSAIPTYRVCELARKRVTVALSGDGGDENFAGYRRYKWSAYEERIRRLLPQPLRSPLFGFMGAVYPKLDWAPKFLRAKSTFQALARDSIEGYFHSVSVIPDHLRARLFSEQFRRDLQGYQAIEVLSGHAEKCSSDDHLSRIQYADIKTYLTGDILTKVDRASMAHSLEVRVPILDHRFVEWAAGVPSNLKLDGSEGKAIFKKSLRSRLPDSILYRPKMGFGVPIGGWFRGPLRERVRETVLGPRLAETGFFDPKFLERLVNEHQSGMGEHSPPLWSLLMFDACLRSSLA